MRAFLCFSSFGCQAYALPLTQCLLLCRLHGYGGFAWDREFDKQKEEERQLMLTASSQTA